MPKERRLEDRLSIRTWVSRASSSLNQICFTGSKSHINSHSGYSLCGNLKDALYLKDRPSPRRGTASQAPSLSFSCLTFFHYKLALLLSLPNTLRWLLILSNTSRKRHKTILSLMLVHGPKTKPLLILPARYAPHSNKLQHQILTFKSNFRPLKRALPQRKKGNDMTASVKGS